MVLTKKYTIENYKTGDIELLNISDKVYGMTFETIFKCVVEGSVGLRINFIELLFFIIFENQGWRVIRLPINKRSNIGFHLISAIESNIKINGNVLYSKGTPDFLLWKPNEKKYKFVEIKCTENCLNSNQKNWFEKSGYNLFICKLAELVKNDKLLTYEEMIEQNKFVR